MKRSLSTVAVALAAVVALGATAPAASAAGKTGKPSVTKTAKSVKTIKVVKADKRLIDAKRAVAALVARKDAALVSAGVYAVDSGIAQAADVQANVGTDRAHLAELGRTAAAATTLAAVRAVDAQVRQVRPENYAVVVNGLRQAADFQDVAAANPAVIADLEAQATAKEGEGYDVTAVRQLLADATAANDQVAPLATAAIAKGIALTALSAQPQQVAFSADVAAAGDLLEQVAADLQAATDALAAMVPAAPVTEQPVA